MHCLRLLSSYRAIMLLLACSIVFLIPITAAYAEIQGRIEVLDDKYRVGPGDVLSYQVYHQSDLAQEDILVRPDGYASFNGLGELFVAGKTIEEITQMLRIEISELVISPRVTVTVTKTKPATVYLAGAVMHPGMFQISTNSNRQNNLGGQPDIARVDFRVSNILANAGGVMMTADLTQVEVRRGDRGPSRRVNLWRILKEGAGDEDVFVQSGDTIYVPQKDTMALNDEDYNLLLRSSIGPNTFPVRVIGFVGTPGIVDLQATSPYLNSAIAKGGGFKENANKKVIAIRRFTGENSFNTLYVDPNKMDVVLRPNDVVYVSELKIYTAGRFFEQASRVLAPFSSLANSGLFGYAVFGRR